MRLSVFREAIKAKSNMSSSTSMKCVMCPGKGFGHDVSIRLFGDSASMETGHIIPLSQMLPSGLCMGCSEEEEEEHEEDSSKCSCCGASDESALCDCIFCSVCGEVNMTETDPEEHDCEKCRGEEDEDGDPA